MPAEFGRMGALLNDIQCFVGLGDQIKETLVVGGTALGIADGEQHFCAILLLGEFEGISIVNIFSRLINSHRFSD